MNNDKKIGFEKSVEGLRLLAAYVAERERQGVTYRIDDRGSVVFVKLTGGF
jgi:hypothetical protein